MMACMAGRVGSFMKINMCEMEQLEAEPSGDEPRGGLEKASTKSTRAPPLLAVIRAKCLDCCAGQVGEIRKCVSESCVLWPYRMGDNPFSNRKGHAANLLPGAAHANDNDD